MAFRIRVVVWQRKKKLFDCLSTSRGWQWGQPRSGLAAEARHQRNGLAANVNMLTAPTLTLIVITLFFTSFINPGDCQACSWDPSAASTKCGVVGQPAHFSFKSFANLQSGNLFIWKLDGTELAAFEYISTSKRFDRDGTPSSRVNSNATYTNNAESEHSLTIKSLAFSDDGKKVTFQREGCSAATEKAQPITLSISCCDPSFFGNNASTTACGSAIKCGGNTSFSCNGKMYQAKNFTAVCQANSTWDIMQVPCEPYCDPLVFGNSASTSEINIKLNDEVVFTCNDTTYETKTFTAECQAHATWNLSQHACVTKTCSELPKNVVFTDSGIKNISGGESKSVSCDRCATVASAATGTCVTDDNVVTVYPPLTCTSKNCSVLPANSKFENNVAFILCGEPEKFVVCASGFTGLSGTTGLCSTSDGIVTLSQNLTCTKTSSESDQLSGGAIAGIVIACLLVVAAVVGFIFLWMRKDRSSPDRNKDSDTRLAPVNTRETDENDPTVSFKPDNDG